MTSSFETTQALILGTGIAGLSAALKFAKKNIRVTLACKADAAEGSTRYAQGGIASVWSKQDSIDEHKADTFNAGAGLCHEDIVDLCVREGPERVRELIELGVQFTRSKTDPVEEFDLHREGGHTQRRILHANDLTGWEIERALLERARNEPAIRILENHIAIDLITAEEGRCLGAYVLDILTRKVVTLAADVTVLATGGAGKVYLYTSNPDTSTGDGIAIAHRAGAKIANLEFMQFHPTCLYHPGARTFLISEALRGEGAVLRNLAGQDFMSKHHPMASLAPRDIVARAIDMEMKRTGDKHVLLDCSRLGTAASEPLQDRFPNIYETCMKHGIDIARQPIPVVPAAHYTCGGVQVDQYAQTCVQGLYAVGEVACTGLHGANRLASNSLLEAVVFAHRAVEHAAPALLKIDRTGTSTVSGSQMLPKWDTGHAVQIEEQIDIAANWLEIRHLMWNYVGIVRSNRRLERAKRRIGVLEAEINTYYWDFLLTKDLVELRNLITVADLTVRSASQREESRGLHYTVDYPKRDDLRFKRDTVL